MFKEKNLVEYYKELWNLPSYKFILPILAIFNLALLLIIYFNKPQNILFYFYSIFLLFFLIFIFKQKDKYLTWKRLSGIALFNFTGIFLAIISYILLGYQYSYIANVIVTSFLVLSSITLFFISIANIKLIFLMTNFFSLIFLYIYNLLKNSLNNNWSYNHLFLDFFSYIITFIIVLGYLYHIKIKGEAKYDLNPILHFRNFILTWLNKESSFFENVLKNSASNIKSFKIPYLILKFKNTCKPAIFFSLPIHPGPLLTVGSSDLPSLLLSKTDMLYLPFHGPSTHKEDLINYEEKKYLISLLEQLQQTKEDDLYTTEMISIKKDNIQIKGFLLNETPIIIISPIKEGIDDIDPEIARDIIKIANDLGFKMPIIIDAHNYYSKNVANETNINEQLIDGIRELLSKLTNSYKEKVKVGISDINFNKIDNNEIGYGNGRIIVFKTDNFINMLILIDSNNITSEFRNILYNEILSYSKKFNYKIFFEICSTDTHVLTARFQGGEGYYPLGHNKKIIKAVVDRIILAIEDAINVASEVKSEFKLLITPPLKILGELYPKYVKIFSEFIIYGKGLPLFVFIVTSLINYLLPSFVTYLP
jgi:predicted neutral ceramidase superfamily lipid hydrolase